MTTEQKTFNKPQTEQLPILICLGTVGTIGQAYMKDSGNVIVPLILAAQGAGKDARLWPYFKPEWLSFGFDPDSLTGGYLKGYQQNVAGSKGLSVLQALAGSEEGFSELCSALDDISVDPATPEEYCEAVTNVLSTFVQKNKPLLGYVLSQKKEDKKRTPFYEVNRFFYPTDKQIAKEIKTAEKSAEKVSAAWERIKAGDFDTDKEGNRVQIRVPVAVKVTFDSDTLF